MSLDYWLYNHYNDNKLKNNKGGFMYEQVLENIKYYFNKTDKSIDELSEITSLSKIYLKSLLNGTRKNPSLDTIDKLATAFNVDIMELIGIK